MNVLHENIKCADMGVECCMYVHAHVTDYLLPPVE